MWRFLAFCCVFSVASAFVVPARRCPAAPVPNAEQLQQCLLDLGHARFETRQRAVRELVAFGVAALPIVTKAIDAPDAEVRARAVDVLLGLSESEDPTISRATRSALRRLASQQPGVLTLRAQNALDRQFRADMQRLQQLGAKFDGATKLDLQKVRLTPLVWELVAEIATLTKLQLGTATSDDDLQHLRKLRELKILFLHDSKITDAGLVHLAGLTKLTTLNLHDTQIKGPGLRHLKKAVGLQELDLRGPQTTDETLQYLQQFPQLETLYLARSQVTDAGLPYLKAHPGLKIVALAETKVTAEGVRKLRKSRVGMRVYFD
jgi:hypothetical protein